MVIYKLHWGQTLQHKMTRYGANNTSVQIIPISYNASQHGKQYWDQAYKYANYTSNHTNKYAENQFLKKSRMLSDMINPPRKTHSFATVVTIASIFLFVTMTISAAVIVFCRKKNAIFAFQKCDQDTEVDYELEDVATDIEYTETDFESEMDSMHYGKSLSFDEMDEDAYESSEPDSSPTHRPLVRSPTSHDASSPSSRCHCGADSRGGYQRMVPTKTVGKAMQTDPSADDMTGKVVPVDRPDTECYPCPVDKSDIIPPHVNSIVNEYADEPPSYESIKDCSQQKVIVDIEQVPQTNKPEDCRKKLPNDTPQLNAPLYVDLPPASNGCKENSYDLPTYEMSEASKTLPLYTEAPQSLAVLDANSLSAAADQSMMHAVHDYS